MVSIWTNAVTDTITATANMVTMASMAMARSTAMATAMVMGKTNKSLVSIKK